MREDLKLLGKVVGAFLLTFGCWVGCIYYTFDAEAAWMKDPSQPRPINHINGIAVDSGGNIYVGDAADSGGNIYARDMERSIIQVFQADGTFLYWFPAQTSRYFILGIDRQDVIHVASTSCHYGYLQGKELFREEITYEEKEELKARYHMSDGDTFQTGDKTFRLSMFHRLTVTQGDGSREVIILQAPYWPPPYSVWWGLSMVSLMLCGVQIGRICKPDKKTGEQAK